MPTLNDFINLGGWNNQPKEVDRVVSSLKHGVFYSAGVPIRGSGRGKKQLLYKYVEALIGKFNVRTQVGPDCVACATATAIDIVKACEIVSKGELEEWVAETTSEDIYVGSRIQIGKGQLGNGGGSIGAWAAKYVKEYGTLVRQPYGSIDLSKYDYNKCTSWERTGRGVPSELLVIAKEHQIRTTSLVTTYEEVCDSIYNGYAVTVASNRGFSSRRDAEGFASPEGTWPHQLCCLPQTIIKSKLPSKIEDITIGRVIFGHDGKEHRVTEIYRRDYSGKIINIKCYGANELSLTPNHQVLAFIMSNDEFDYKENDKSNIVIANTKLVKKWVCAKDIKIGDYLVCPGFILDGNCNVPQWEYKRKNQKNIPTKIYIDDDIAWLFGMFVADGYAKKNHKVVITLGLHEMDKAERCRLAFSKLGLYADIRKETKKKCYRVTVYSSIASQYFSKWFGKRTNKHLPIWIFSGWNLKEVLNGIFEGDGNLINKNKSNSKRIVNTSRCLIDQIHTILISLGEKPRTQKFVYNKLKYKNQNIRYIIEWTEDSKKIQYNKWINNDFCNKVYKITESHYDGNVYNLEVDGSNSYIAEGLSVHNCVIGYDDEYRRPGVLFNNSWGVWNDGPTRHEQPPGSFWVDADVLNRYMLSARDSWAYSDYDGFQPKELSLRLW